MLNISNILIPPWAKYLVAGLLVIAVWGHGYVKGVEKAYTKVLKETIIVYKNNQKLTDKVIKKEVPKAQALKQQGEKLKKEGQSYEIQFPNDSYTFNDEFVRLFNNSLDTDVSSLSK